MRKSSVQEKQRLVVVALEKLGAAALYLVGGFQRALQAPTNHSASAECRFLLIPR